MTPPPPRPIGGGKQRKLQSLTFFAKLHTSSVLTLKPLTDITLCHISKNRIASSQSFPLAGW